MSTPESPFSRPEAGDRTTWPANAQPTDDRGARSALWPERIIALAGKWKGAPGAEARRALLSELWPLINAALLRYLGAAATGRPYFADPEVLRDIASEKALNLVQRLERESWDPGASTPGQLCSFLGVVARNGLADHERVSVAERRRAERLGRSADPAEPWKPQDADGGNPETTLWREQFARALTDCVHSLTPRAQTIWFLKIFYELGSHEVGRHADVNMKPGTVDVAWGRCRRQIQSCLVSRGFTTRDLPVGTFATIWRFFRVDLKMEV